jgi:threonine dehydrogenase-like Zn-dependent dehydrogenase
MARAVIEHISERCRTMKAMVLVNFGEPMVLQEVPEPPIGKGDVLLRVRACGLCGTDVKIFDGQVNTVKLPRIMGWYTSTSPAEIVTTAEQAARITVIEAGGGLVSKMMVGSASMSVFRPVIS